jgi:hypothetical protein
MRTVTDVSAVAWDVATYNKSYGGWLTAAGTSVAAPLIRGVPLAWAPPTAPAPSEPGTGPVANQP